MRPGRKLSCAEEPANSSGSVQSANGSRFFAQTPSSVFLLASNGGMRQLLPVEARNLSWGTGATTALIALPIAYVLSIGPVVYAIEKSGNPQSPKLEAALIFFYTPLGLLAQHTPLRKPLFAYIQLWVDLD